ncbi:uncharacterized protein G2W53_019611 [Senna tora]|uniref:Uncharacterized protein n=1 Tax=Senna tora TaxID=362788 RepID=A0A834TW66_9FABA|nr:uncharacterized protein G2W53_019611 [Senna tora]
MKTFRKKFLPKLGNTSNEAEVEIQVQTRKVSARTTIECVTFKMEEKLRK